MSHRDLDLDGILIAHANNLTILVSFVPALFVPILTWIVGVESFYIQVLIISHRVSDAPCNVLVVPEMRESGHTGKGKADHIKLRAAQMILIINVGHI